MKRGIDIAKLQWVLYADFSCEGLAFHGRNLCESVSEFFEVLGVLGLGTGGNDSAENASVSDLPNQLSCIHAEEDGYTCI